LLDITEFRLQKLTDQLLEVTEQINESIRNVKSLQDIDNVITQELVKASNTYKMLGSVLKA